MELNLLERLEECGARNLRKVKINNCRKDDYTWRHKAIKFYV